HRLSKRLKQGVTMHSTILTRRSGLALAASGLMAALTDASVAAPAGTMTVAVHVSLAPAWFDPGETGGYVTAYMLTYGLHDALVKAMPEGLETPGLASAHIASADGLTHEFVLRD